MLLVLALYDGVIRPGAQTPAGIVLDFIIIGISLYGIYLFLTRSLDIFRHPDVKISALVPKTEPARVRQFSKDELFSIQIKNLYDSLDKEDIAASLTGLDSIGDTMNVGAADLLVILLEYPDEPVRVHAAFALGQLSQKTSVEPLIKALDDPSVQVRENAAIALGKIGDQRAVAPLQQVSTEDVRAKKAAVGALARIDLKLGIYNKHGSGSSSTFTALALGESSNGTKN